MKKAKRLVKKVDGIQNLSELVREMIEEKAKVTFARSPKAAKLVGSKAVAPAKPAGKGRTGNGAARGTKTSTRKGAAKKAAIVVTESASNPASRRTKKGAGANGLTQVA